jgi:dihydrofolate synthase/folylpolyglutamate synthase
MPPPSWEDFYSLQRFGMTPDLNNILHFCERLGHPESSFPSIHIGGTNGKGSVTALVDSILRCSGYHVGMYTSPHIRHFEERIRVDGKLIEETEVFTFLQRHWDFIQENHCTFFEVATAMAFDYFRSRNVNVAVVEVGLGGTYDATRVVSSLLSIITHIDYDHMDRLGNTLEKIAADKAGIFRSKQLSLTGNQRPEILDVLKDRAREIGTNLHEAESLISLASLTTTPRHNSGTATLKKVPLPLTINRWKCPLTGEHQKHNIRLALAAGLLLMDYFPGITPETLSSGISAVNWPGRLQPIRHRPWLVLDVGHNPGAISATLESIHKIWKHSTVHVIFSALRDKDIPSMISCLKFETGFASVVPLPPPRGLSREEISALARESEWNAHCFDSVEQALLKASSVAGPQDVILVIGSHYLAAEVLKIQNIS